MENPALLNGGYHFRMGDDGASEPTSRRDKAVARSLDTARLRAERRVERFLDAALELMARPSQREFTVQEVVELSGQSLRTFYQYFAGKHELLLALLEEAVAGSVEQIESSIDGVDDPLERLRAFTVTYHRMCRPEASSGALRGPKTARAARVMAEFAQQLLTEHSGEAARVFAPLAARYETLLDEAAASGAIRAGLDHRRITGVVLQAVMFNTFADTISGTRPGQDDRAADDLWELLLHGLASGVPVPSGGQTK